MPDIYWAPTIFIVPILIGFGASVMSWAPPEFAIAKLCFSISAFILAARLGWWLAVEQTLVTDNVKIALVTFIIFGGIGILWVGSLRWVNGRQKAVTTSSVQGAITQEQPPVLMSVAMKPKSFPSWTPPTGKFHTGLRECVRRGRDLLEFYLSPERESDQYHREWKLGVGVYIASRANNVGKSSFTSRWGKHDSPNDSSTLPVELHGRNRKLYADILSRIQLLEEFVRELEN